MARIPFGRIGLRFVGTHSRDCRLRFSRLRGKPDPLTCSFSMTPRWVGSHSARDRCDRWTVDGRSTDDRWAIGLDVAAAGLCVPFDYDKPAQLARATFFLAQFFILLFTDSFTDKWIHLSRHPSLSQLHTPNVQYSNASTLPLFLLQTRFL